MSATITWSHEGSHPCSWESLLRGGSTSLKNLIPSLSCWSDHLSCSYQCVGLLSSPSCSSWDVAFFLSSWSMTLIFMIHALKISRMVVSVTYCNLGIDNPKSCHVWMICNVTSAVCQVRSVAASSVGWVRSSWAPTVVAVSIQVLWSRLASMGISMTQVVMSSAVGLWSWLALSVYILMVMPQAQSGMVTFGCLVMCHWCSGRRYSVWAVYGDMTVFITFLAPNVRTMSCNVSWFLALKAAILFIWHHFNCWGCDDHCCELLCGIEFFHFWDGIHKCLRSFIVDVCC